MIKNDVARDIPIIQWYPGHMKKARELVEENLKLVDVVVELLDARIPAASANPMLREIVGDKPRVVALNKRDLADEKMTKCWLAYFRAQKLLAVALDSVTGKGMRELLALIEKAAKHRTERLVSKGVAARKARVMILGIPNVGKSSLINRLAGAAKAKTVPASRQTSSDISLASMASLNTRFVCSEKLPRRFKASCRKRFFACKISSDAMRQDFSCAPPSVTFAWMDARDTSISTCSAIFILTIVSCTSVSVP